MFWHKSSQIRPKVLHIATGNYSPRVIQKEVSSLAATYDVYVLQAVGLNDREEKAQIYPLSYYPQIWKRVLFNYPIILYYYFKIRPQIVHLHLWELVPFGCFCKLFNTKIILDVYENMHKKIASKEQYNQRLYKLLFQFFDKIARKYFFLIFAENTYLTSYPNLSKQHTVLLNYPRIEQFSTIQFRPNLQKPTIFYVGQISEERAFDTILKAICILKNQFSNIQLNLFGYFNNDGFAQVFQSWISENHLSENVHYFGMKAFEEAAEISKDAFVGLALLKDFGDYRDSYPTKMFEYMATALPVITADFPHCLSVIQQAKCGFGINSEDENALVEKILWLLNHPNEARAMGEAGKKSVGKYYNWRSEEKKLLDFYQSILNA